MLGLRSALAPDGVLHREQLRAPVEDEAHGAVPAPDVRRVALPVRGVVSQTYLRLVLDPGNASAPLRVTDAVRMASSGVAEPQQLRAER